MGSSLRKSDIVNNLKVLSNKTKVFVWAGVIGILGVGYNVYHWFDGLTQNRIGYLYAEGIIVKKMGKKRLSGFKNRLKKEIQRDA